jgi:thiol:disulfide interchange protein DsbC
MLIASTAVLGVCRTAALQAQPAEGAEAVTLRVLPREQLAAQNPGLAADDIGESPVPGFYEVVQGNQVAYLSGDGRFLLRGDLIDLATRRNLTDSRRAEIRASTLATVDAASEIVFSPANGVVLHRVTVFTDVDCGYCRQLHRDIAAINAFGIEVRYLSFPRTGPDTDSWAKAEGVWCAADRNAALTAAKLGGASAGNAACTETIKQHYELARRIGVSGTPAVYTEAGVEIGGYLPPSVMLEQLESLGATR